MRWIEVCVQTPSEEMDRRCEEMAAMGAEGFVIEDEADFRSFLENNRQYWDYVDEELESRFSGLSRIKCYLADDESGSAVLERVIAAYGGNVSTSIVQDSDWENNWRQYYVPIETGRKLVVVPEWLDAPEDGRIPLRLDPGLIFGTGSHPTTKMCLAALEDYASAGKKVLDLGCGSGILGIGALLLGCESCTGADIDPKAPDVALSNAKLNGINQAHFRIYAGDILKDIGMRKILGTEYDIILANIVSDVIIPLAGYVRQFMKKDAVFITSGIIEGRQDDVLAALTKNGFQIDRHFCEEEWHCFVCSTGKAQE
ncbi:MAG: 50S ribosomal protein L11 methyltransferase [Oscillospiraceae bacterium]|nr:50S ribosomal protein L11 methyltransferase [Oscillospiraceae bacterium]